MGGRRRTRYCETCGHPHAVTANFCGSCGEPTPRAHRERREHPPADRRDPPPAGTDPGAPRGDPAARQESRGRDTAETRPRNRRRRRDKSDADRREVTPAQRADLEQRAKRKLRSGWDLEADHGDHVVLTREGYGSAGMHVLVGLFTFWWTFGIGNALYAASSYYGDPERLVLRARTTEGRTEPTDDETQSHASTVLAVGLLWLVGLGFLATASVSGAVIGLCLLLASTALVPPVRRRLGRRRAITTNGRAQSVDEHVVHSPSERCASCGESVTRGVERTYRDEYYVGGVPTRTYETGSNVYCESCAAEDPLLGDALASRHRPRETAGETAAGTARPADASDTGSPTRTGGNRNRNRATDDVPDDPFGDEEERRAGSRDDEPTEGPGAETRTTRPATDRTGDDPDVDQQVNIGDQPDLDEYPDGVDAPNAPDDSSTSDERSTDEDVEHEST